MKRDERTAPGVPLCLTALVYVLLTMTSPCALAQRTAEKMAAAAAPQGQRAQAETVSAAATRAHKLLAAGDSHAARAAFSALAQANDADAQDALAAMWLEGIGGPADREIAMYWFCRLAHQPRGGRAVMRALWFLAEYFRTGGGLPGRRYAEGARDLQNPLEAYFWYQVMVQQGELYDTTLAEARTLGRIGSASVARELREGEKQQVARRVQRWSPSDPVASAQACLNFPQR